MRTLLLMALLVCAAAHAADPEFKPSIVTASRTYERQESSIIVGGIAAGATTVSMSRVTVALDGLLVTAEWEPKTLQSASAKDFRRGTDVMVAISRNRLLLKHPDGSVVTARIVSRDKQKQDSSERPRPRDLSKLPRGG